MISFSAISPERIRPFNPESPFNNNRRRSFWPRMSCYPAVFAQSSSTLSPLSRRSCPTTESWSPNAISLHLRRGPSVLHALHVVDRDHIARDAVDHVGGAREPLHKLAAVMWYTGSGVDA